MKKSGTYIWVFMVILFISNQFIERVLHIYINFMFSYFDDLLAVPILVGTYQLLIQQLKKDYSVSVYMPIVAAIMLTIQFEIIMPQISSRYTSDVIDILMYCIGAILFISFLKPTTKNSTIPVVKNF